ncbi:tetratricopeptide repeat protein [Saccharopolyspora elongata]|uniref:Tetratricopeptide repeat protein n=1 Tax=Saccharopolyspora elongata TaxID=2530387 RepID=A0A4R4ZA74_9PSEU|nr:tetratricopeptide repeat protein [Saccharopolyspora elongata]
MRRWNAVARVSDLVRSKEGAIASDEGTPALRFAVLGPLRAWCGDEPVGLGPVRQQAVLAALLLNRNAVRTADELLGAIWGKEPPASGSNVVSVYLYRLRAAFRAAGATDDVIRRHGAGYQITASAYLDAAEFDGLVDRATAALAADRQVDAEAALTSATALLDGEPLAGLPGGHAAAERQRLLDRGLTAWRRLADLWIRSGRHSAAIDALSALIAEHPYDEPSVALLMRARYGGGWVADALQDYRNLRDRMVRGLGVEPGHELRALHQAVLREDDVTIGLGERIAPPVRRGAGRVELPPDNVRLEGRADQISALTEHLSPRADGAPHLVAVDGIAGVGKSALVVYLAHQLRPAYPDGALFLDLHGHTAGRSPLGPADALGRLLRTIGVADRDVPDDVDERAAVWRAATADAQLLVVLDNAASAEQVRPLLPGGGGNRVLVTSRTRLVDLDVDHQVTLDALGDDAATALLSRLIGAVRAEAEPGAVRDVVRACGGLPLALRIVAARMRSRPAWTFAYLASRLADGNRRLSELAVGDRSIEAAFALSYSRLPAAEQRIFRLLGEIPGIAPDQYCVAALADVAPPEAGQLLERVVDAGLLDVAAIDRYRLHDLATDYARRLAESAPEPGALERVLDHYQRATRRSRVLLTGEPDPEPDDRGGFPFTDAESAADWLTGCRVTLLELVEHAARTGHLAAAGRITSAIVDPYTMRTWFSDARRMHECVLAAETDPRRTAPLWTSLANVHGMRGAYQQARDCFEKALTGYRALDDEEGQTRALGGLGAAARSLGRHDEAAGYLTRALGVAEDLGYDRLRILMLSNLGMLHGQMRRHDVALEQLRAAAVLAAELNDPRMRTMTVCALGEQLCRVGATQEAGEVLAEALDLAQRTGDVLIRGFALTHLGTVAEQSGDLDTAIARHLAALDAVDADAVETTIEIRNHLGDAYLAAGRPSDARKQFLAAVELTESAPSPVARARALRGLARCGPQ